MIAQNLEQAWSAVCAKVKEFPNVDASQVNAFFPRLQVQAMSDGFLMVTADNDFIKSWIERHYRETIAQALQELYGMPYTVLIEVDPTQSAHPAASAEATPAARQKPPAAQEPATEPAVAEPAPEEEGAPARVSNNPFRFENFVIGDSNRLAYTMAVAVAEAPGTPTLNPLFIYGRSGLGKTHLLRAIENTVNDTLPAYRTVYVDSAEFLNDFTEASITHDREKLSFKNFKNRYEEADVLLIDDVQFFQGKQGTLDMVFQIFNKLVSQGKQVVLSADRAPKNIDMDERYQSRFSSGGICDIQPPDVETKLGIVKSFLEEYNGIDGNAGVNVPADIQLFIAENSSSNIRELKSAITKVIYHMTVLGQGDLSISDVRMLLESHFSNTAGRRVAVADIQREAERFYQVSHADLVGKKRSRNIVHARQVAIYLSRQLLNIPFNEIGRNFNRDHSTAMYSHNTLEEKLKESRDLREEIETLQKVIRDL